MADDPFDPPGPPAPSALTTAGHIALGMGVIAADILTGGILSGLASIDIPGLAVKDAPQEVWAQVEGTAAPQVDTTGNVVCTGCAAAVPFASMALSEHGYFCARCVVSMTS